MENVIHKYALKLDFGMQILKMPMGAEILTAQIQGEQLVLWAKVNSDVPAADRKFEIVGTGQSVQPNVFHISTIQSMSGTIVFHLFEILK